jgi:hypothetical protein
MMTPAGDVDVETEARGMRAALIFVVAPGLFTTAK